METSATVDFCSNPSDMTVRINFSHYERAPLLETQHFTSISHILFIRGVPERLSQRTGNSAELSQGGSSVITEHMGILLEPDGPNSAGSWTSRRTRP